jgi:hypothetical protein
MRELLTAIPDVEALLALEPEELGAKLLFLAKTRREGMFSPDQMASELWSTVPLGPEYPRHGSRKFSWHWAKRGLGSKLKALSFPRKAQTAETAGEC